MEFDYVQFLCMNLIGTNKSLAKAYSLDQRNHTLKEDFEFYYDEGFVDFMIKALRHSKNIDFLGMINCINFLNLCITYYTCRTKKNNQYIRENT